MSRRGGVTGSEVVRLGVVTSDESDAERVLLQRLGRDPEAICAIYDRYLVRLVRFLQHEGASSEVAWDAAQETFARLLATSRRRHAELPVTAWPWLSVTGRNLLRDWARRGRVDTRARRRLEIASQPIAADEIERLISRLEADEESRRVFAALDALAREQRQAVAERVIDELDYPELAARAGVSEEAVRTRVSRGLRRMRTLLDGGG